jgi:ABC-type dipeptide/oligopeptide/nickel transport system ATPase subunit
VDGFLLEPVSVVLATATVLSQISRHLPGGRCTAIMGTSGSGNRERLERAVTGWATLFIATCMFETRETLRDADRLAHNPAIAASRQVVDYSTAMTRNRQESSGCDESCESSNYLAAQRQTRNNQGHRLIRSANPLVAGFDV